MHHGCLERDLSSQLGVEVRAQGLAGLSGAQPGRMQFLVFLAAADEWNTKRDLGHMMGADPGWVSTGVC